MKVLIIGLGSIARKHISALRLIYGQNLEVAAWRHSKNASQLKGVLNLHSEEEARKFDPRFIIISNHTSAHFATIKTVLDWNKPLFIEKPLSHSLEACDTLNARIKENKVPTYVACNLRFLSAIKYLKDHFKETDEKIQEVNIYCGSFLPDWRPDQDYKKSYSSIPEMGGGVHLDLIHEIDYLIYLFGYPKDATKRLTSHSDLEIKAVDYAHYTISYTNFTAAITLNYFRRKPKREIEIVTQNHIYQTDLISNKIEELVTDKLIFQGTDTVINTYEAQLRYFLNQINQQPIKLMNSFEEASEILKIVLDE